MPCIKCEIIVFEEMNKQTGNKITSIKKKGARKLQDKRIFLSNFIDLLLSITSEHKTLWNQGGNGTPATSP